MQDPPANSKQWSVAQFANLFNGNFPQSAPKIGEAYTNYANQQIAKDPSVTPYVAAKAFLTYIMVNGLGKAITQFAVATGQSTGKVVNAIPSGVNWFHGLDLEAFFVRIGELILGVILVGVGVAKLTGTTNLVADIVKTKLPV